MNSSHLLGSAADVGSFLAGVGLLLGMGGDGAGSGVVRRNSDGGFGW